MTQHHININRCSISPLFTCLVRQNSKSIMANVLGFLLQVSELAFAPLSYIFLISDIIYCRLAISFKTFLQCVCLILSYAMNMMDSYKDKFDDLVIFPQIVRTDQMIIVPNGYQQNYFLVHQCYTLYLLQVSGFIGKMLLWLNCNFFKFIQLNINKKKTSQTDLLYRRAGRNVTIITPLPKISQIVGYHQTYTKAVRVFLVELLPFSSSNISDLPCAIQCTR